MAKPLVSVVIPCYNDWGYIQEAIDSVFCQTYSDLEVIVVDDGSSDIPKEILESVEKRVTKVIKTPNRGPAAARNLAIQSAKGEYILPLDADDKIDSTYIEKAAAVLEERPKTEIVYCKAVLFGLGKGPWKLAKYDPHTFVLQNTIFATAMFRKASWEKVGGYSENMVSGIEDYDFWIKLVSMGGSVVCIEEPLFHYRIKPKSRTTSLMDEATEMRAFLTLFDNNINFFSERKNVEVLYFELRKYMKRENELNSSRLWRYLFQHIVRTENSFIRFFRGREFGR